MWQFWWGQARFDITHIYHDLSLSIYMLYHVIFHSNHGEPWWTMVFHRAMRSCLEKSLKDVRQAAKVQNWDEWRMDSDGFFAWRGCGFGVQNHFNSCWTVLLCWSAISNQSMLFENLNLPGKVLYAPFWSRVFHGWGRKGSQSEVVHAYMMFVLVLKEVVISSCKKSAQVDHRIVCFPFQSFCTRFAEWGFANVCAPVVLDVCCFSTIFFGFPVFFACQVNFAQARLREMTLKDAKEVKPKPDSASDGDSYSC